MKRDKSCRECEGTGWVLDYLGGCGDPECCGGPVQSRCPHCDNDWEPSDPGYPDETTGTASSGA